MNSDQYLKKNDRDLNGQNLIKKPVKRDLTRVGVVDIGSNSVRLVVFDGAGRSPAYFYNEKIMCGLGSGNLCGDGGGEGGRQTDADAPLDDGRHPPRQEGVRD